MSNFLTKEIMPNKNISKGIFMIFVGLFLDAIVGGLIYNACVYSPSFSDHIWKNIIWLSLLSGLLFAQQFLLNSGQSTVKLFFSIGILLDSLARAIAYLFCFPKLIWVVIPSIIAIVVYGFFFALNIYSIILISKDKFDVYYVFFDRLKTRLSEKAKEKEMKRIQKENEKILNGDYEIEPQKPIGKNERVIDLSYETAILEMDKEQKAEATGAIITSSFSAISIIIKLFFLAIYLSISITAVCMFTNNLDIICDDGFSISFLIPQFFGLYSIFRLFKINKDKKILPQLYSLAGTIPYLIYSIGNLITILSKTYNHPIVIMLQSSSVSENTLINVLLAIFIIIYAVLTFIPIKKIINIIIAFINRTDETTFFDIL